MRTVPIIACTLMVLTICTATAAPVPELINYQGELKDSGGTPLDGVSVNLTFNFYDALTSGNLLLTVQQNSVAVNDGVFNVLLGSGTVIPTAWAISLSDLFLNHSDVWMSVQVNSDSEMTPRKRITSTAFAFRAETVSDGAITSNKLATDAVTSAKIDNGTITGSDIQTDALNATQIEDIYVLNTGDSMTGSLSVTTSSTYGINASGPTGGGYFSDSDGTGSAFLAYGNTGIQAGGSNRGAYFYDSNNTGNAEIGKGNRGIEAEGSEFGVYTPDDVYIGGYLGVGTTTPDAALTVNGAFLKEGSTLYGTQQNTHVNLGGASITGAAASDHEYAVVGGGFQNTAGEGYATVSGGISNEATGYASTIAGGWDNEGPGMYATVSGGTKNSAVHNYSTVAGGYLNTAQWDWATVGGGQSNLVDGWNSTVAGGVLNTAADDHSTVGGGSENTADGDGAVVAGGSSNTASGAGSMILGGNDNTASGSSSCALGALAVAGHTRTFVWNGDTGYCSSTGANQFLIRASGGVGIGTASPDTQLHVTDSINGSATLPNHVALIENTSTGTSPDVLALKVGYTGTPSSAINFLTFFRGDDVAVGAVDGNSAGGVTYRSGAADYAEWLPRLDPKEAIEAGDVVGVFAGKVSRRTEGADRIMVVSQGPIVLGNDPGEEDQHLGEKIAFLGQVDVKVSGAVACGDVIVGSGKEDGTAVAVAPEALTLKQAKSVVGQALEGVEGPGVHRVKVLVGLEQGSRAMGHLAQDLKEVHGRLEDLTDTNAALLAQNVELTNRLASLETQMSRTQARQVGRTPASLVLGCIGLGAGFMIQRKRGE